MKEFKKEFRWFSITEYDKEAEYLSRKHKEGWKFVTVTGIGKYLFEKCEPEDVVYQLDYNQEGIEHKEEYVQMFADCGWDYIMDFMGYSYFRKKATEMNGEEEIFCDDESRLAMLNRVLKGRLLPLLMIFIALIVPQLCVQMNKYFDGDKGAGTVFTCYGIVFVLYMIIFVSFSVKYIRYKKAIRK